MAPAAAPRPAACQPVKPRDLLTRRRQTDRPGRSQGIAPNDRVALHALATLIILAPLTMLTYGYLARCHSPSDRWFVDETYVKVKGVWRYVYRAIDQHGQVVDVLVSARRDATAARRFFTRALRTLKVIPSQVVTDAAPVLPPPCSTSCCPRPGTTSSSTRTIQIEADHGQLKRRLRPMRGLQTDRTAQVVVAGHAFVQNLRRGHYELGVDPRHGLRIAVAFTDLAQAI